MIQATVTPSVPATGIIRLSQLKAAFPGITTLPDGTTALSRLRNAHPSVPAAGSLNFSHFRGLTAVTPALTALSTLSSSGTNITLSNLTIAGFVSASQVGSHTLNIASYLENASFHGTMTYAVTAGTLPSGVTLSSAGILSSNTSAIANTNVTITATNAFGNSVSIPLRFDLKVLEKKVELFVSGGQGLSRVATLGAGYFNGDWFWNNNLDNRIVFIRVGPGTNVRLYQHPNRSGVSEQYGEGDHYLPGGLHSDVSEADVW